jgi:hypothetical protein
MIAQRLTSLYNRTLRQPDGDVDAISSLPAKVDRASLYLAFDAAGDVVPVAGTTSDLIATAFVETLLDDADAATARTTLEAAEDTAVVKLAGTQTVTGDKTFSGDNTHSGANTFSGATSFTGQASGFGIPVVKRKTADESVISSETLQDDNHLLFAVGANEEWVADFVLDAGDGLISTGLKVAVTTPSGATLHISAWNSHFPEASGSYVKTAASGTALAWVAATHAINWARVQVSVWVLNGATPGNVTLQFAQQTSFAANTTLFKGSHLVAHRIA